MESDRKSFYPISHSVITCPDCGFSKKGKMPTNACQYFYKCTSCGTLLKPKAGDCCVYCSYGTEKCPPFRPGLPAAGKRHPVNR